MEPVSDLKNDISNLPIRTHAAQQTNRLQSYLASAMLRANRMQHHTSLALSSHDEEGLEGLDVGGILPLDIDVSGIHDSTQSPKSTLLFFILLFFTLLFFTLLFFNLLICNRSSD